MPGYINLKSHSNSGNLSFDSINPSKIWSKGFTKMQTDATGSLPPQPLAQVAAGALTAGGIQRGAFSAQQAGG